VAATLGVIVIMLGLVVASPRLYRLFCAATGLEGTTQVADAAPGVMTDRWIEVRFDSSVAPDLPWTFEPEVRSVRIHPGETTLVSFTATNHAATAITGHASYNVTPLTVGSYFDKIQCFCFTEQVLKAGETVEMPVSFFVNPAMFDDRETRNIPAITLSYTFFRAREPGVQQVAGSSATASPR